MRLLVAILSVLVSVNSFAQTRKNTTTKRPTVRVAPQPTPAPVSEEFASQVDASRYPLHSTLHQTPEGEVGLLGSLGMSFGSSSVETPNTPGLGVTSTDENESAGIFTLLDISYGALPQLVVGLELGYESSSQKNVKYSDTAGNAFVPLLPDVKSKGLYDPKVYASFRPVESDLVVDLGAALRLGFMGAERSVPENTIPDAFNRADKVSDNNFAQGSYGAELGARAGYHLTDRLNLVASAKGEYNFAGNQNFKSAIVGDIDIEQEAYTQFSVRGDVEYFLTPKFVIAPFANLIFGPKLKSSYRVGVQNTKNETAAGKTYSVGVSGGYLMMTNLALKLGYSFTSSDNAKTQTSTNGAAFTDISNSKDLEKHSIVASAAFEF